jgi:Amidases related to nicotinamidase
MNKKLPKETALIIIDVQKAIDNPSWSQYGVRNNLNAEKNMAEILSLWRKSERHIFHVKHESTEPNSTYRPGQVGCDFKECVTPLKGEHIVVKHVNNAFIGTGLELKLKERNISFVVIFGVITNNSVDASVRMSGNLGFATYLIEDACFTYAKPDYSGQIHTADEVHAMTLANLDKEYCQVISTYELKKMLTGNTQ